MNESKYSKARMGNTYEKAGRQLIRSERRDSRARELELQDWKGGAKLTLRSIFLYNLASSSLEYILGGKAKRPSWSRPGACSRCEASALKVEE